MISENKINNEKPIPEQSEVSEKLREFSEDTESHKIPKEETKEVSRRDFLRFLGATGAAVVLDSLATKKADAEEELKNTEKPLKNNEGKSEESKKENVDTNKKDKNQVEQTDKNEQSYKETMVESGFFLVGNILTTAIFTKLGIPYGRSLSPEEIERIAENKGRTINQVIEGVVLAPVLEEAILRALPSSLIGNNKELRWDIGIPTSALFALAHNFNVDEFDEIKFEKSIPITQFMSGLFYWYLMRKGGYSHAVLSHSLHNSIGIKIAGFLLSALPENKEDNHHSL